MNRPFNKHQTKPLFQPQPIIGIWAARLRSALSPYIVKSNRIYLVGPSLDHVRDP